MPPRDPIDPRDIVAWAEAAGLVLPAERIDVVSTALNELLELAAGLQQLPLDGVAPAAAPPRWT
jgi:hypothetical protein